MIVTTLAFWIPWSIGAVLILLYSVLLMRSIVMSIRYAILQQIYNVFCETKLFLRVRMFLSDFRQCFSNPDGYTHNMNRNVTAWPKLKSGTEIYRSTDNEKTK